jgi:hypothetical protein
MFVITDTDADAVADRILTVKKHTDNNCSLYFSTYILHLKMFKMKAIFLMIYIYIYYIIFQVFIIWEFFFEFCDVQCELYVEVIIDRYFWHLNTSCFKYLLINIEWADSLSLSSVYAFHAHRIYKCVESTFGPCVVITFYCNYNIQ